MKQLWLVKESFYQVTILKFLKDGTRMPGVVTLHQDSETQTNPSYFRGQYWGAIGLLIGKLKSPFCLPLALQIHQGRAQIEEDTSAEKPCATLGERLATMALECSLCSINGRAFLC